MNNEYVFEYGNYQVFVLSPEVRTDLGSGQIGNYEIVNTDTNVTELTVSTFTQAIAGSIELHENEQKLHDYITQKETDGEMTNGAELH